ncbi:MAG: methyltransferase, TIGR04325 family [Cyanobacteriota bacterium]|nr:methyltransferase, TIGR04325 family [Cyanobacteriota bacterium]
MKIRDWIPPILSSTIGRMRSGSGKKRYASYSEALADCSADGYENHDVVDVVVQKTLCYRKHQLASSQPVPIDATSAYSLFALLLAAEGKSQINVIDFGGAAGAHYFLARSLLPSVTKLNWLVVETPAMANRARAVLADEELRFSSDLAEAAMLMGEVDLLHTSGTLQCVANPYADLRQLMRIQANHLLLNRLGVTQGDHDVITVHQSRLSWNGPGAMPVGMTDRTITYPFVFPQEAVLREIVRESYQDIACFADPSGIFPVWGEPIIGLGLLASRRCV